MDSQILEHFKQINNLLKNRQEPVNIFQLSKKFNVSVQQSQYVLNCFIAQGNNLKDYIVIFRAEVLEENKIKTIFLPSYSPKLNDILEGNMYKLLEFGVFAICKKVQDFELKDFSVFCYENELIENIKVNKIIKQEKNSSILNSTKASNTTAANKTIQVPNASTSYSATVNNQNLVQKTKNNQNDNKSVNKSESSLSKVFNNKININKELSKPSSIIKPVIQEDNFTPEPQFGEIIGIYEEINAEDDQMQINSQSDNISSSKVANDGNECYYENSASIFGDKTRQNNHSNSSNVIINYNPKIKKEEKPAFDLPVAEKRKRMDMESDSDISSKISTKKKNETADLNVSSIQNSQVFSDDEAVQSVSKPVKEEVNGVRKVKKSRKIKKTNTYFNAKGYLETNDEEITEEYWSDEKIKPLPIPIQQPIAYDNKNKKPTGNKKVATGQSSLHSFFRK